MARSDERKSRRTNQPSKSIPTFRTLEEEASFWDTHDLTKCADELEAVDDVAFVKPQPLKAITVRIDTDALAIIAQRARERGISTSTLVRWWILERLRHEKRTRAM